MPGSLPYCPRCNSEIDEEDNFCPYCGLNLIQGYHNYYRKNTLQISSTRSNWFKWGILLAIIIIVILIIGGSIASFMLSGHPDIRVVKVEARSYIAGLDVRAVITATLYNYGTANGYATVKFYTMWNEGYDEYYTTVFVPAGQYATAQADLDIPAFSEWIYNAKIVSQNKA